MTVQRTIKIIAISSLFLLSSCGALTNKNRVYKTVIQDKNGENITIYRECNPQNLLKMDPYCYREVIKPQYCYYTLGEVNCYDQPLGGDAEAQRVK